MRLAGKAGHIDCLTVLADVATEGDRQAFAIDARLGAVIIDEVRRVGRKQRSTLAVHQPGSEGAL